MANPNNNLINCAAAGSEVSSTVSSLEEATGGGGVQGGQGQPDGGVSEPQVGVGALGVNDSCAFAALVTVAGQSRALDV